MEKRNFGCQLTKSNADVLVERGFCQSMVESLTICVGRGPQAWV
jgi:hypothetical protein